MAILDYFRNAKPEVSTAKFAKERLQIIVAHERSTFSKQKLDYLPQLERDILAVIQKYVEIKPEDIQVQVENTIDDISVLEVNITLPDGK